jgi:UDP-2,3-diacylglucosamine pyrophosphatase LpxH
MIFDRKIKSLFISDIHLGSRSSKTKELLELFRILEKNQPEQIFIVGDFIDFWILKSRFYWNEECNTVLQKLLRLLLIVSTY